MLHGWTQPVFGRGGMVVSANAIASHAGVAVLQAGGTAVDAVVATAFVLAVTYPTAGNIGGGGFLLLRPAKGESGAYDFRETAPALASPTMFLRDGKYDFERHHNSHVSVGVTGHGGGASPRVEGARQAAMAASGAAGDRSRARRLRRQRGAGAFPPGRHRRPAQYQARARSSRRTGLRWRPATCCSNRISRERWSASPLAARRASTTARPRRSSKRKCRPMAA